MTDDNWAAKGLDYTKLSEEVLEELSRMPDDHDNADLMLGKVLIGMGGVIVAALIAFGVEYLVFQ